MRWAFTFEHWDGNDNYPDMLGQCYHYLCEYLMRALVRIDYEAFESGYSELMGIMLLYQEFTRRDVREIKEAYKQKYVVIQIARPLIEYSAISGYAYLWGELVDPKWKTLVASTLENDFSKRKESSEKLYTQWVELAAFWEGDLQQIEWQQRIARTIQDNNLLEYEHVVPLGSPVIKTENQFVRAFLGADPRLMFNGEAHEIHLVLSINKYLPTDKHFESRWKWEEEL